LEQSNRAQQRLESLTEHTKFRSPFLNLMAKLQSLDRSALTTRKTCFDTWSKKQRPDRSGTAPDQWTCRVTPGNARYCIDSGEKGFLEWRPRSTQRRRQRRGDASSIRLNCLRLSS